MNNISINFQEILSSFVALLEFLIYVEYYYLFVQICFSLRMLGLRQEDTKSDCMLYYDGDGDSKISKLNKTMLMEKIGLEED